MPFCGFAVSLGHVYLVEACHRERVQPQACILCFSGGQSWGSTGVLQLHNCRGSGWLLVNYLGSRWAEGKKWEDTQVAGDSEYKYLCGKSQ